MNPERFDPFHSLEAFTTAIPEFPVPYRRISLADDEVASTMQETLQIVLDATGLDRVQVEHRPRLLSD
jgi:hypothetical protein